MKLNFTLVMYCFLFLFMLSMFFLPFFNFYFYDNYKYDYLEKTCEVQGVIVPSPNKYYNQTCVLNTSCGVHKFRLDLCYIQPGDEFCHYCSDDTFSDCKYLRCEK